MEKPNKQKHPKSFSKCRSLSESSILNPIHLLDNSPRSLMLSLQHKRPSPEFGFGWKIRTNDLAVEEILRDRQEAIRTGKLRGRRLFEDTDGESVCSYDNEIENKSSSGSDLGSYVCDKCMEKEVVAVEGEKGVVFGRIKEEEGPNLNPKEEEGIRVRDYKGWFAIGLSVCVIGAIGVWGFWSHGDVDDQVMFLVPT